jgi:hypothetical protein
MTKTVFYKKVGRKYEPVSEYDQELLDAFPKGSHIVICYPGGKSIRYNIDPAFGPMIAAGQYAEDDICNAIRSASEAQPKEHPITHRQRAAWEEMKAAFGDEFFSVTLPATRDITRVAVRALQEEADKLMQHPAVRNAYEQFLTVCELCKEQK